MKVIQDILGLILRFHCQLLSAGWQTQARSRSVQHPAFLSMQATYKSFRDYSMFLFKGKVNYSYNIWASGFPLWIPLTRTNWSGASELNFNHGRTCISYNESRPTSFWFRMNHIMYFKENVLKTFILTSINWLILTWNERNLRVEDGQFLFQDRK